MLSVLNIELNTFKTNHWPIYEAVNYRCCFFLARKNNGLKPVRIFPHSNWIRGDASYLCIQSEYVKMRTRKTSNNGLRPLTIFAKSSIINAWQSPKYASFNIYTRLFCLTVFVSLLSTTNNSTQYPVYSISIFIENSEQVLACWANNNLIDPLVRRL